MTWMLVGSFAVSAVGGIMGAQAKKKQAYRDRTAQLEQEGAQWDRNEAENRAIGEANLTNSIRTGFKVGLLNLQEAQDKKRAIQSGTDLTKLSAAALSSATANASAAGSIGPSVDAVIQDIEVRVGDARNQQGDDWQHEMDNFDTQLHDLLTSGQDSIRHASKGDINKAAALNTAGTSAGEAILGAAVATAGSYFSQKMKLGLGTPSPKGGGTQGSPGPGGT